MKKVIIVIAVVFAGIFAIIRHNKQKELEAVAVAALMDESALDIYIERIRKERDANKAKELAPEKKWGTAGTAVRTFFQNWESGRYNAMHAAIISPSNDADAFSDRLRSASTVNWRRMQILAETETKDGWDVDFAIEATSPESALAAVGVNAILEYQGAKGRFGNVEISPLILGIESFTAYKLKWRVIEKDGKTQIGAYPEKGQKGINLLSYVINDTIPMMRRMGMFQGQGRMPDVYEQMRTNMAFWLTFVKLEIGFDEEQMTKVTDKSLALINTGIKNIGLINKGVIAKLVLGKQPVLPQ